MSDEEERVQRNEAQTAQNGEDRMARILQGLQLSIYGRTCESVSFTDRNLEQRKG